jgi:glycosyltransferase involved in cell wall biosynthesis
MRILYVSSLWSGLPPLLFEGAAESNGMPAFLEPLRYLLQQGHQIRIVFLSKRPVPETNIQAEWLTAAEMRFVDRSTASWPGGKKRIIQNAVEKEIREFQPDVMYTHGTSASPLWKLAEKHGIPSGHRVYGVDNFPNEFRGKPSWWIHLRKPGMWHAFNGRKSFVIATRDGSRGDLALQLANPEPDFKFFFWANGFVPVPDSEPRSVDSVTAEEPYLFCPARFSHMKAKHRTVTFLHKMHELGRTDLKLVVAGQKLHQEEWDEFWQKARELKVEQSIICLGEISRDEVRRRCAEAVAVLSLYRFSNMSNVTIETLACAGVLAVLDDGSLEGITSGEDVVMGKTVEEVGAKLNDLLNQPEAYWQLRENALKTAEEQIGSWQKRASKEEQLLSEAINGEK